MIRVPLSWRKVELFKTPEEVKRARQKLEEVTRESFAKFARARRECWQKAKRIILD